MFLSFDSNGKKENDRIKELNMSKVILNYIIIFDSGYNIFSSNKILPSHYLYYYIIILSSTLDYLCYFIFLSNLTFLPILSIKFHPLKL